MCVLDTGCDRRTSLTKFNDQLQIKVSLNVWRLGHTDAARRMAPPLLVIIACTPEFATYASTDCVCLLAETRENRPVLDSPDDVQLYDLIVLSLRFGTSIPPRMALHSIEQ